MIMRYWCDTVLSSESGCPPSGGWLAGEVVGAIAGYVTTWGVRN
jgi:hypothetical protein